MAYKILSQAEIKHRPYVIDIWVTISYIWEQNEQRVIRCP